MADDPKDSEPATPPVAAGDKPAGTAPGEPIKTEVSRTDSPGAGASAAPVGPPRTEPPAPKPANPEGAVTATTSETSSATGQPTAPAADVKPAAPTSAASAAAAGKPASGAEAAALRPPAAKAAAAHEPPKAAPPSGPTDPPPPADTPLPAFITGLQRAQPSAVAKVSLYLGDWTVIVPVAQLLDAARHLRDSADARFDFLSDVTATDWPPRAEGRFDVIYCLYSTFDRHRLRIKVIVGEATPVPSVTGIWTAANWLEREVWDMFGINFTGHPDRRRILMPDDWQGHPQRKDYPLEGPGEMLLENPLEWLKLRQSREQADIE